MKRQQVRKGILIFSFLLLPVTMFYLSPMLIMQGAKQGKLTPALVFIFLLFGGTFFLGRVFCSWVCPAGALQEMLFAVNNKPASRGKATCIKYFIWGLWVVALLLTIWKAGGFSSFDLFFRTSFGVSLTDPSGYSVYYGAMVFIFALSLWLGRRSFCQYVCILTPFMVISRGCSQKLKAPRLHLEAETEKCINCRICNNNCPMSLDVNTMVQEGNMENHDCILCGACVDSCPKKVISMKMSSDQDS
ncbi:MAG: 4Fe-4S binding protein [Synergistales bacterium]|nr:4Fe-4S binding protein [Synergistales bacterium]